MHPGTHSGNLHATSADSELVDELASDLTALTRSRESLNLSIQVLAYRQDGAVTRAFALYYFVREQLKAMKSKKSEVTAGYCRECHSDVQLANRIYFCRCGSTSDESYDSPPSWIFKLGRAEKPIVLYKVAKAASGDPFNSV